MEYLNLLSFSNNAGIEALKNTIKQINKNVLGYLLLKKAYLQQLEIKLAHADHN